MNQKKPVDSNVNPFKKKNDQYTNSQIDSIQGLEQINGLDEKIKSL